jgi:hypothetical protein
MTPRSRPRHEGFPVYNGIIPDFWTMQTSCQTLEPFQCRLEVFDNLRNDLVGRQQRAGIVQRAPLLRAQVAYP